MADHDDDPVSQPSGVFPAAEERAAMDATPVDPDEVLARLESLEINEWVHAGGDGAEVTHLGPAAEQFHEVFELGVEAARVATGDVDGVLLAATRQLARRVEVQQDRLERQQRRIGRQRGIIDDQRDDLEALRERVESLQSRVDRLQKQVHGRE